MIIDETAVLNGNTFSIRGHSKTRSGSVLDRYIIDVDVCIPIENLNRNIKDRICADGYVSGNSAPAALQGEGVIRPVLVGGAVNYDRTRVEDLIPAGDPDRAVYILTVDV